MKKSDSWVDRTAGALPPPSDRPDLWNISPEDLEDLIHEAMAQHACEKWDELQRQIAEDNEGRATKDQ